MKREKFNRPFGPAGQKFCRSAQDLTGPKTFFYFKSKELYSPKNCTKNIHYKTLKENK